MSKGDTVFCFECDREVKREDAHVATLPNTSRTQVHYCDGCRKEIETSRSLARLSGGSRWRKVIKYKSNCPKCGKLVDHRFGHYRKHVAGCKEIKQQGTN